MRENHYLDDGAYSAVQTIIEMVRQALSGRSNDIGAAILADLTEPTESKEYRLKVCGGTDAWRELQCMPHAIVLRDVSHSVLYSSVLLHMSSVNSVLAMFDP